MPQKLSLKLYLFIIPYAHRVISRSSGNQTQVVAVCSTNYVLLVAVRLSSEHVLFRILMLARFIAMYLNESVPPSGNYSIVLIPVADERYFSISWVMTFQLMSHDA